MRTSLAAGKLTPERNTKILPAAFLILLIGGASTARNHTDHPSEVSRVLATYRPANVESYAPAAMAAVGKAFLSSLEGALREEAVLELTDAERGNWTNVPPRADEAGTRLGDLGEKQLKGALDLLVV
ncbi:MAG: DUF3500 domain-containing protein [bacterium]|nr:DUF3500 domain-containing protein [bacterium]